MDRRDASSVLLPIVPMGGDVKVVLPYGKHSSTYMIDTVRYLRGRLAVELPKSQTSLHTRTFADPKAAKTAVKRPYPGSLSQDSKPCPHTSIVYIKFASGGYDTCKHEDLRTRAALRC